MPVHLLVDEVSKADPAGTGVRINGLTYMPNGLRSPYYRILIVDQGGQGNYTTIQAAITFAASQQTGAFEKWGIVVNPGTYTEDVTVTRNIHLLGCGWQVTSIVALTTHVKCEAGGSIHRTACYNFLSTGCGVEAVLNTDAQAVGFYQCYIVHSHASAAPTVGLRVSGTAAGCLAIVMGGFIYAQNTLSDAAAIAHGVHLTATQSYVEVFASHIKTSSRLLGKARLALNEGATSDAHIHIECPWIPAKTDGGAIYAILNSNVNARHRGLTWTGDLMPGLTAHVFQEVESDASGGTSLGLPEYHARKYYSGGIELPTDPMRWAQFQPLRAGVAFTSQFASTKAAVTATAGQARAFPMVMPTNGTLLTVTIEVTTAVAATSVSVALYADDNGRPGTKVADLGTFSAAATGLLTPIGISVALTRGLYWVATATASAGIGLRNLGGHAWTLPQTSANLRIAAYHSSYAGTFATPWPYLGEADFAPAVYFTV